MQRKILRFMPVSAALGRISAMDASRVQARVNSRVARIVLMARLLETKGLMRTVPLAPQLGAWCADAILARELHGWQCALGLQIALQSDAADLELPIKRFLSHPARIRLPLLQRSGPNGYPKPKAHSTICSSSGSKRTPGKDRLVQITITGSSLSQGLLGPSITRGLRPGSTVGGVPHILRRPPLRRPTCCLHRASFDSC